MKAIDCANYLIYLLNDSCEDLTNMKLNKILFYAQGQSLKQHEKALFPEAIEAWQHGPVVPQIYHHYKQYRNDPIHFWEESRLKNIEGEEKEILFNVGRIYSMYTAATLRNMTHAPKGVWAKYYKEGEEHTEIPIEAIKDYFDRYEHEIGDADYSFTEEDFIGYRDESDHLVLPRDWHD